MMLLPSCEFSTNILHKTSNIFASPTAQFLNARKNSRTPRFSFRCISELASHDFALGSIADVLHNKVMVAAALSSAIGRLSKPFTSAILYGKKFDFRAAIQAGGFPSTHSSVIFFFNILLFATGFSDVIFGLAIVYASLIMYDAQGVRRQVGIHAKELNKVMPKTMSLSTSSRNDANDLTDSFSKVPSLIIEKVSPLPVEEETSFQTKPTDSSSLVNSDNIVNGTTLPRSAVVVSDAEEGPESFTYFHTRLKESIGHTEIEVAAGALLGFLVLVASALSAAIGQLSKPFTSTILYGKKFDFSAAIQAGGFPSTHSSAAVATATSLALDRGFSDAVFGLAVVYACLIMYDAQGVRRQVGIHAKELNKILIKTALLPTSAGNDANDSANSFSRKPSSNIEKANPPSEEETSFRTKPGGSFSLLNSDGKINGTTLLRSTVVVPDAKEGPERVVFVHTRLKETIGHTKIEVAAGALLGFLVSLTVCPYV
ncbi:hypothetical protein F511_01411 [Dorcoceras hygrometricum]|uniref:Acid phosphatase/vanadium-dependent haloperoxidase-related protein n=1 Tax=Dorcoceras hygrometricum TaxID=472368 RepID=A0A2Z7BF82_9LAMI|nr:hypothetical protein F511_01411 [Dorcoceras hygrometricum]